MKFGPFFGLQSQKSLNDIASFLTNELGRMMNDLSTGLSRLTLLDNFRSFKETVTIKAGQEVQIRNKIGPSIPTARIIVRCTSVQIADGPTPWDKDNVYIKNYGASDAEATILFME